MRRFAVPEGDRSRRQQTAIAVADLTRERSLVRAQPRPCHRSPLSERKVTLRARGLAGRYGDLTDVLPSYCPVSREALVAANKRWRQTRGPPCDIAYAESPTASRAASLLGNSKTVRIN